MGHVRWGPMPEGDTIHRTAAALRTALVDKKMVRFEAPRLVGVVPRAGRTIERVESHGKHLEIEWDDGVILHTHMRMSGSWHLYRDGRAAGSARTARCAPLIEVDGVGGGVLQRPGRRDLPRARTASRHPGLGRARARPRAASTPTSTAASSCCSPTTIRERPIGRGAPRPACVLRRRQRVPLRGAVGRAS